MNRLFVAAALATLPLAAATAKAPMTAATYMMKAGAGDQYEIQSSKIVLQSTTNSSLKGFANTMVTDHMKSTADVKAAAMSAHLHAPAPKLDAMGMKNVAALRAAHGTARDQLYVKQQKVAHQNALMLHQGYAANGSVASLKTVASNVVPVVQSHITMLSSM